MSNSKNNYNVRDYYNRFDPSKNYEKHLMRAGYVIQSTEINEVQENFLHKMKGIGDALFKDGDIVSGCQISVNEETGEAHLEGGTLYLNGSIRNVLEARFIIPLSGQVDIGIYLQEKIISELEDPSLKNPAIGSRGQGEAGAWRLQVTPVWGAFRDENAKGDFYPVHIVDDGIPRAKELPPTLNSFTQSIAKYDRESTGGGTYVTEGLVVRLANDMEDGTQVYTISEGKAHVNGYSIELATSRRLPYSTKPDLRFVDTEVIQATGEETQRINVAHAPISSIAALRVVLRKTISLVHGAYSGATDALPNTSIMEIVEVRQGDTVYENGTDYTRVGDAISWAPLGAEPAPNSTFQITYDYLDSTLEPKNVDDDGFSVSNAVANSSIMVSYYQSLPRIDALCISQEGEFTWVQGVANEYSPRKATIPTNLLGLASIYQIWRKNTTRKVENDSVRVVPFSDMEALASRVDFALAEVARQALEANVSTREAGARAGIFTDSLLDDSMRDQGIPQNAAIVNGVLTLPLSAVSASFSADIAKPMSRNFSPSVLLAQELRTSEMKVNPYMAFALLPAPVTLTPAIDRWTEQQTNWTSSITQVFGSGNTSSTSTSVQTVSTSNSAIENLRQIDIAYKVSGFGAGENLASLIFDGIDVTPENLITANSNGELSGSFTIPENVPAGAKTVSIRGEGGTEGSAVFVGQGTLSTTTLRQVHTTNIWWVNVDPLAQTFTLEKNTQLAGIDLWFTAKNSEVRVQLREVENGVPTRTVLAEASIAPENIVVSGGGHTRILFDAPVAILAGTEYAFVVLCNDADTAVSVAEMGSFDSHKQTHVTAQPYTVGVLLSSSNASTWTAHQSTDLTFRILEANYATSVASTKEIDLGTAEINTEVTDIILYSSSETPSADTRIEYTLTLPNGTEISMSDGQPVRLSEKCTGQIACKACLKGSSQSPILYPGSQLLAGTVEERADYYTRSVTAISAVKALLVFDALIPSGSSVLPQMQIDSGEWLEMVLDATVQQGDGLVEYSYSYDLSDIELSLIKARFTLTGNISARPEVSNIRLVTIK